MKSKRGDAPLRGRRQASEARCGEARKVRPSVLPRRTQGALTTKISENYHRRRCHQYGGRPCDTTMPVEGSACLPDTTRTARVPPRSVHPREYRRDLPYVVVEHATDATRGECSTRCHQI
ncbi:hypothetical protein PUN28_010035 [Cardiocondyla obscurior]|uniref:Uncharacterized protein n=1 Tax=Cardiocondyla obscurior TaxID=286306 RepID=A0AAW2FSK2_9HYME